MKKHLPLLLPAAAAALLAPAVLAPHSAAGARPPVRPAQLLAAVDYAEAQRRAAAAPEAVPASAAADLDKMADAAARLDPARIDPKIALGALSR
jgi:hypothetical protein